MIFLPDILCLWIPTSYPQAAQMGPEMRFNSYLKGKVTKVHMLHCMIDYRALHAIKKSIIFDHTLGNVVKHFPEMMCQSQLIFLNTNIGLYV